MAAKFTYSDFKLFSGATEVNEHAYVTIAHGVIEYIKTMYGIYPEAEDITVDQFIPAGRTSFYIQVNPVNSITSITYDGTVYVEDTDYTFYGDDVELTTALTEARKPLTLALNVGFTEIPYELKLAVYRHIEAVYFAIDQHTDNIEKTINPSGNTTYYITEAVPPASLEIYRYYAGRSPAAFYV